MARPKKIKGKRDITIKVYLAKEEKECLDERANSDGLSTAAFVRNLTLAALKIKAQDKQHLVPG